MKPNPGRRRTMAERVSTTTMAHSREMVPTGEVAGVPTPRHLANHRRSRSIGAGPLGRRTAGRATWVIVAGCALLIAVSPRAGADTTGAGSGGGTVTVGAGAGRGTDGSSSGGGSSAGAPSGGGSAAGSPWSCTYTYLALNNAGGFANGGPTPGAWYSVTCVDAASGVQVTQTEWITSSQPVAVPTVDPRTVALEAESAMVLPTPVLHLNPSGTSVVDLETWLWIDP